MLFCEFRAKIFVPPILLFGDLIGRTERIYKLPAIYWYSVTGNIIQVGLQGSFSVVFSVGWLIVFEFLNSFHLWDFKVLQWCSEVGAWCFKTVWWSPNIRHQSPSVIWVSVPGNQTSSLNLLSYISCVVDVLCRDLPAPYPVNLSLSFVMEHILTEYGIL
jgi:hypothetical protein